MPLRPLPTDNSWSAEIITSVRVINDIYQQATAALSIQSSKQRYISHADLVINTAIPLLKALSNSPEDIPKEWFDSTTRKIGKLIADLEQAELEANGVCALSSALKILLTYTQFFSEEHDVVYPIDDTVKIIRNGRRGRPRKVPSSAFLANSMSAEMGVRVGQLADTIGIHRNTLRNYLKDFQIDFQYSKISDLDLDTLIRDIRTTYPDYGIRYLTGTLRARGYRIQKRRIIASLHRVDVVGITLRTQGRIRRRKYQVTRPQALWHLDGHHKLIRWGIVIHGIVDGYCRTVCNNFC
jgi:hypothetical protein